MGSCVRRNTDFWGADIRDMRVSNIEECAGRCLAEPQCKSLTYHTESRNCWLKNKVEGENGPSSHNSAESIRADCLVGDDFGELLTLAATSLILRLIECQYFDSIFAVEPECLVLNTVPA